MSIVACVAIVMVVASSCASVGSSTEAASSSTGANLDQQRSVGAPFEFGSAAAMVDDEVPEADVGVDPTVPIRTGDTLGDLAESVSVASPTSVLIAGLDIDAPVSPVGIDADGAFDLPPGNEAGWYRFGPVPGSEGSAVLAAHVDWNGVPGAFFNLREATSGDRLTVVYEDGSRLDFEIIRVDQYEKTELPLADLFTREGPPQLALITCGGDFDRATRSYEDNVVVIAIPV